MQPMWMVRSEGGALFDAFMALGICALGWQKLGPIARQVPSREALIAAYAALDPGRRRSAIVSGASQVWRFVHEVQPGDHVLTYSPQGRIYRVGVVQGEAEHRPAFAAQGCPIARAVDWLPGDVPRDSLRPATRNSLGPTLTLFRVKPGAARQLLLHRTGGP